MNQRKEAAHPHTKPAAHTKVSEHAAGSAALETVCSKRARTPQAVGIAAGTGGG